MQPTRPALTLSRHDSGMKKLSLTITLAALLLLAACAPSASSTEQFATSLSPAEENARQTAIVIWHRMEIGKVQTGSYTSNVLIDLAELPRGVAFIMESFPGESFEMRVTDDAVPGVWWLVSPAGVTRHESRG